jgi:hypothetical protein
MIILLPQLAALIWLWFYYNLCASDQTVNKSAPFDELHLSKLHHVTHPQKLRMKFQLSWYVELYRLLNITDISKYYLAFNFMVKQLNLLFLDLCKKKI